MQRLISIGTFSWRARLLGLGTVLLSVGLAASTVASHPEGVAPPPRELIDPKAMLTRADAFVEEKKPDEASYLYRKAMFIRPTERKASRGWEKIQKARAAALAAEAVKYWEEDPGRGAYFLRRAAALHPKDPTVKKLSREHGYREFRGEWLSKEQIAAFQENQEAIELARKKQISVTPEFALIYRGPFRFFTDVDTKQAKSTLQQMTASVESHWQKYREVMRPFELRIATDLDVVLFATKAEYMKSAGVAGSAGVYYSGRGAGYFYGEGGWNFSTMLHEMTHQLNDKLLGAHGVEAWYEEGIAEYFGAGFLTQGGRRIELGRVDPHRMRAFQEAVRGLGGRVIPLDRFVRMARAELSGEFYAQAWALTHFLMEIHPYGRAILFDYIEGNRRGSGETLPVILERYQLEFQTFEKEFIEHYRTGGSG